MARCTATTVGGQCRHEALEDEQLCKWHIKNSMYEDNQALRTYLLTNTDLAESAGRHSQVEELKSLREEIALCRMMVERRLNMVENNADFLSACGQVNTLLLTLDRLITSCHRLEVNLGTLLSKAAILDLAREIVSILMTELEEVPGYEAIVDRVSEKILTAIAEKEKD